MRRVHSGRGRGTGDGRRATGRKREPSGGSSHWEMHPEGFCIVAVPRRPPPVPGSSAFRTQRLDRIDARRAHGGQPTRHRRDHQQA